MKVKNYGRVVTPFSGVHESGIHVPSLRLFLPFSEGRGNATRCPVSGAIWDISNNEDDPTSSLSWESGGAAISSRDGNATSSFFSNDESLDLSFKTGKSYLFMSVGRVLGTMGCRTAIGDINKLLSESNGIGFGMSDGSLNGTGEFHCAVGTSVFYRRTEVAAGTDLCTAQSGKDVVTYAKYVPETPTLGYQADDFSDGSTLLAADSLTSTSIDYTWNMDHCFRFSGYALYGSAFFEFDSFPSWIDTAIYWMAGQWRYAGLGKPRYIYPMLRSYTG